MPVFLKKIELFGFKSFADRSKIEFNSSITAIIGPNGSGKSNIVDAVRWVLGENSAKVLRGDTFEDILFAGSQYRPALSVAEVSLLFDNSKRVLQLPVDEVEITKRYYRSGEGKILLNKQEVRVKDIVNLFLGTGFGKEGYSIVGQGEVDKLVVGTPLDKRNYIDELLGLTKVKFKKKDAERRLHDINYSLSTVTVRLESLEKDYSRLKEQVQKLKTYRELVKQLEFFEKAFFKLKIEGLRKEVLSFQETKNNILLEIEEVKANLERLSSRIENIDLEIQSKSVELSRYREDLNNIEKVIKSKEIERKDFESKIDLSRRTAEILSSSIDKETKRKKELFKEKENILENLKKIDSDILSLSSQVYNLDLEIKELESRKKDLESRRKIIFSRLSFVSDLIRNLDEIKKERAFLDAKENELESRKSLLIEEIQKLRLDIEENDKNKMTILTEVESLKEEKTKKIEILELESSSVKEIENSIIELQAMINSLTKESERMFSQFSKDISSSAVKVGEFVNKVSFSSEKIISICDSITKNTDLSFVLEGIKEIKDLVYEIYNDIRTLPFLTNATEFISKKIEFDNKILSFRKQIDEMYVILNSKKENLVEIKEIIKDLENLISGKEKDLYYYEKRVDEILKQIKSRDSALEKIQEEIGSIVSKRKLLDGMLAEILLKIEKDFSLSVNNVDEAIQSLASLLNNNNELESVQKEIERIDLDISSKKSEFLELNTSLTVLSSNKESSYVRIQRIDEEIKGIDNYITNKIKEVDNERDNILSYEDKLKKVKEELENLYLERDKILKIVSGLSYEIKTLNEGYRKLINEKEGMSGKLSDLERELFNVEEKIVVFNNNISNIEEQLREKYNISYQELLDFSFGNLDLVSLGKKVGEVRNEIKKLGFVDERAEEEFSKVSEEYEKLKFNLEDILNSKEKLEEMVANINKEIEDIIENSIDDISKIITDVFREIFGGGGVKVEIVDDDLVEGGIEIIVNIPGKKVRNLMLLSGGEKTLVGIIFIFAALMINKTPVVIMDEVDAPLDDENTERFKRLLLAFQDKTQFIVISHNKSTIEICRDIYGVTMEEKGVSKVVSYRLQDFIVG